jgi:hypothetical protein
LYPKVVLSAGLFACYPVDMGHGTNRKQSEVAAFHVEAEHMANRANVPLSMHFVRCSQSSALISNAKCLTDIVAVYAGDAQLISCCWSCRWHWQAALQFCERFVSKMVSSGGVVTVVFHPFSIALSCDPYLISCLPTIALYTKVPCILECFSRSFACNHVVGTMVGTALKEGRMCLCYCYMHLW